MQSTALLTSIGMLAAVVISPQGDYYYSRGKGLRWVAAAPTPPARSASRELAAISSSDRGSDLPRMGQ